MKILFFLLLLLGIVQVAHSFVPAPQQHTIVALHLSSIAGGGGHLYRDEPTELERDLVKKEEHDPKHSSFHVEQGPGFADDKIDPAHSFHHHLIDVDHDKLHDLELRAQKAWLPVNVHEVDVDPVTLFAALFGILALILFTVQ